MGCIVSCVHSLCRQTAGCMCICCCRCKCMQNNKYRRQFVYERWRRVLEKDKRAWEAKKDALLALISKKAKSLHRLNAVLRENLWSMTHTRSRSVSDFERSWVRDRMREIRSHQLVISRYRGDVQFTDTMLDIIENGLVSDLQKEENIHKVFAHLDKVQQAHEQNEGTAESADERTKKLVEEVRARQTKVYARSSIYSAVSQTIDSASASAFILEQDEQSDIDMLFDAAASASSVDAIPTYLPSRDHQARIAAETLVGDTVPNSIEPTRPASPSLPEQQLPSLGMPVIMSEDSAIEPEDASQPVVLLSATG